MDNVDGNLWALQQEEERAEKIEMKYEAALAELNSRTKLSLTYSELLDIIYEDVQEVAEKYDISYDFYNYLEDVL